MVLARIPEAQMMVFPAAAISSNNAIVPVETVAT
jgi:hypothetical protein